MTRLARVTAAGWAAAIAVIATSSLLLVFAAQRTSPVFFGDEIGYLANSLAISGGPALHLSADSYYPGWSLVFAPLWWFVHDPLVVYRVAVFLAAASGIAMIPVLALLGRRLGLGWPSALIAGSATAALPGHALMSGFALAESFLGLVVAASVLLAVTAAQGGSRSLGAFAGFGAVTAFAFVVHGRVVPLVIAAVFWSFALFLRGRRRQAIAILVPLAVIAGSGYALYHRLDLAIYGGSGRTSDGLSKFLASHPGATALAGSGQFWFAVVATGGLVIPGLIFLGIRVGRELNHRRPGWATWFSIAVVGLCVISFTYVSADVGSRERLDIYVYGRYLEPLVDMIAFFGLVLLARRLGRRMMVAILSALGVVVVGYGLLATLVVPTGNRTRYGYNPMNVLGLAQFDWRMPDGDTTLPLIVSGAVAAAVLVALLMTRRLVRNPAWMLLVAVAYLFTGSILGEVRTALPSYAVYSTAFTLAAAVDRLPDVSISFDTVADPVTGLPSDAISQNAYQFFLAPRSVPVVDSGTDVPSTELTIGRRSWSVGLDAGWRLIAVDSRYDNALWIRPGRLQDELADRGQLLGG